MDLTDQDKSKLFSIFENLQEEKKQAHTTGLSATAKKEVLLVDGYNTFLRCFAAIPSMNEDGLHTGGISGFLKSIGFAIKLIKPDRCVVIFDGPGGSMKRRAIYPEYKAHRKTKIRLNRIYEEISELEDEEKNLKKQLQRMVIYLNNLPVNMLSLDNVEADDTIAYCAVEHFKDWNVTIMSSDKDFLQLVDERVKVWSPTKKKLYGPAEVLGEYGIDSQNFVLFRTLDGDDSDNIPGIKGFGPKTALKAFPILAERRKLCLVDLYEYAEAHRDKLKIYERLLENKQDVERNLALMQLTESQLQTFAQFKVKDLLDTPMGKMNRFEFSKLITEDKMWNNIPNYQMWLNEVFTKLDNFVRD
jgi:DNA polymerase-1